MHNLLPVSRERVPPQIPRLTRKPLHLRDVDIRILRVQRPEVDETSEDNYNYYLNSQSTHSIISFLEARTALPI